MPTLARHLLVTAVAWLALHAAPLRPAAAGPFEPREIASGDALAYVQKREDPQLAQESYRILYPAYGTYLGNNVGSLFVSPVALPIYAGTVVAGHVAGRVKAKDVDTTPAAPSWESEAIQRSDGEIPAVALEPLPAVE